MRERDRKRDGQNGGKGGRIKIEVHCGRRFFALSASTNGGRLRGKFHIRPFFFVEPIPEA